MKADRRHELQQNELAAYLGKINKSIEPYSRIIAVVVGVGIFGLIAYALYKSKETEQRSDATLQLIQAAYSEDVEDLTKVSDTFPGTAAGAWAQLYEGNRYLNEGLQKLFTNRVDAEDTLKQAQEAFEKAIARSDDMVLKSRANLGIARAAESLGDVDTAVKAYEACIAANESEPMLKLAQRRIDSLSSDETQEFLTWFAEQDFSPPEPSLPPTLPGGATLPTIPDLKLPEIGGAGTPSAPKDGIEMPAEGADAAKDAASGEAEEAAASNDTESPEPAAGEDASSNGEADASEEAAAESTEAASSDESGTEASESESTADDASGAEEGNG